MKKLDSKYPTFNDMIVNSTKKGVSSDFSFYAFKIRGDDSGLLYYTKHFTPNDIDYGLESTSSLYIPAKLYFYKGMNDGQDLLQLSTKDSDTISIRLEAGVSFKASDIEDKDKLLNLFLKNNRVSDFYEKVARRENVGLTIEPIGDNFTWIEGGKVEIIDSRDLTKNRIKAYLENIGTDMKSKIIDNFIEFFNGCDTRNVKTLVSMLEDGYEKRTSNYKPKIVNKDAILNNVGKEPSVEDKPSTVINYALKVAQFLEMERHRPYSG